MDVVEKGHTSLKKVVKYWNVPLNSLLDHMNGRNRCMKLGPQGVLTK
jgi:predicted HTH domain antitoxin